MRELRLASSVGLNMTRTTSTEKTTGLPHWDCAGIRTSDPHVLFRPGHNGTLSYLHLTCGRRVKKVQVTMKEQISSSLFPIKLHYLYLLNGEVLEARLLSLFTPLLV